MCINKSAVIDNHAISLSIHHLRCRASQAAASSTSRSLTASPASKRHSASLRHHHTTTSWIQIAKVHIQQVIGRIGESGVFHFGGHFVMHHRFLVFANDVYAELEVIRGRELVGL